MTDAEKLAFIREILERAENAAERGFEQDGDRQMMVENLLEDVRYCLRVIVR